MCGIAGVHNLGSSATPVDKALLQRMVQQLFHRGPDGYGFYQEQDIGLAHARLSIIDLKGGWQPIHNEDKTVQVIFNGEIFNYLELRDELIKRGHVFYTHSDTEVIVHLYETHGERFAEHLNGQFAIALWDKLRRKLILVRDRVGIVPLFYSQHAGRIWFASEVKAILAGLGESPRLNADALDQIMTFWSPVKPYTLFEGIHEVPPGQMLVIQDGKFEAQTYWCWSYPEDDHYHTNSETEQAEQLHDLLIDATRIRLRADVPVGAYLSGGLDSSVLVALIHHHSDAKLRTFSIGFEDKGLDESEYQQTMIQHLGTHHTQVNCDTRDVGEQFYQAIWHTESPVLRTAPVPMGILSGHVRQQDYRVVLTGEGADEVLGGYDIFKESKIRQFWARLPASTRRPMLLKRLYPYLDLSRSGMAYLQSFFGVGLNTPDLPYFSHLPRWTTTAKCKDFFSDALKAKLSDTAIDRIAAILPEAMTRWHPFNKAQYLEANSLMSGYLLSSQGDRMLMRNSVEGRFPYLDHRVIEFASQIHPKLKMKVLNEKYLLKQAMSRYLPEPIIKRYKQPYRAPDIPAFLKETTLVDYANELLSEQKLREYGYFDPAKVGILVRKALRGLATGYRDNMAFVGILSTQIWHQQFVENYYRNFNMPNKRVQ